MPANTSKGYPYPLGTDRLMDGDNAIQALATAMDTKAAVSAAGTAVIPFTAVTTPTSVAVTFPVGRFSAIPSVIVSAQLTAPQNVTLSVAGSVSTTGFNAWGYRYTGTAPVTIYWTARQAD